jgi:hypothetical protein
MYLFGWWVVRVRVRVRAGEGRSEKKFSTKCLKG